VARPLPDCGGWNTLVEEIVEREDKRPAWGAGGGNGKPVRLRDVSSEQEDRRLTHIGELDRVLGGGVVPGRWSCSGAIRDRKSTLMLVVLDRLAQDGTALYVTGEESLRQTRMRADRLGVTSEGLHLLAETDADKVLAAAELMKPRAWRWTPSRRCSCPSWAARRLDKPGARGGRAPDGVRQAHRDPTFIVGHVTKDGAIAGPRVLEHMVDTVLYFEGDKATRSACCARTRTASGRPTRSACSR